MWEYVLSKILGLFLRVVVRDATITLFDIELNAAGILPPGLEGSTCVARLEIVGGSFASLWYGCGLRLVGVHVKVATQTKAPVKIPDRTRVIQAPWSWLRCTLTQWTKELAARVWIEVRELTAEVEDESRASVLRLRLEQMRLEARARSRRNVLNWKGLSLSVGLGGVLSMPDGGHALASDVGGGLEIDIHIARPSIHAPLAATTSMVTLLSMSRRDRGELKGSSIKEEMHNERSHLLEDVALPDLVTVRITTLDKIWTMFEDENKVGIFIIRELRLVCVSRTLVARAASVELRASTTCGNFDGLAVRIELPQWTATVLEGKFSTSDLSDCSLWGTRCLRTFEKLSESSFGVRADATHLSEHSGSLSVPSIQIDWVRGDCHLSAILRGTRLSMTSDNTGLRWLIELMEGCLEINGRCFLMLEMDTSGTRPCRMESLQRMSLSIPTSACSRSLSPLGDKPKTCIIDVPRIGCFVCGAAISAIVDGFHDLENLLADTGSTKLVSSHMTVDIMAVCLGEKNCVSQGDDFFAARNSDWPRTRTNCLLVAIRGTVVKTDEQSGNVQVLDARVTYDGETFLCKQPKANLLLLGEYIAAPFAVVSLSLRGLAWRASAPDARLIALIDEMCNSLGLSAALPSQSLPPLVSKWHVVFYDTFCEYTAPVCSHHDFHVILTIALARITSMSVRQVTCLTSGTIRDMTLFLRNTSANQEINVFVISDEDPVQIATVDILDFNLSFDWMLPTTRRCIYLDSSTVRSYCCSDSLQTLMVMFTVAIHRVLEWREARSADEGGKSYHAEDSLDDITVACGKGLDQGSSKQSIRTTLYACGPEKGVSLEPQRLSSTFNKFLVSVLSQSQSVTMASVREQPQVVKELSVMHHSNRKQDTADISDQFKTLETRVCVNREVGHVPNGEAIWYGGLSPRIIIDHVPVPEMRHNSADGTAFSVSESICLQVRIKEVHVSFFAGSDWIQTRTPRLMNEQTRGQREVDRLVKIVVLHTRCHTSCQPSQTLAGVCMGDFVISESISSTNDRELKPVLVHWRSDALHPRETEEGLIELHASLDGPITAIKVKVLPLRCCLDAKLMNFSHNFFGSVQSEGATRDSKLPAQRDPKIVVIDVAALALKLDYRPRGIDATQLCSGALDELSQAFSLEQVQVTTRRCRVVSRTVALALDHLWHLWSSELSEEQMHKFIFGASVVRPIHAVGTSIVDVISRPLEARSLKNTWQLLRSEFATCGRVLVYESARVSRRLITRLAIAVDAVADNFDGQNAKGRASDDIDGDARHHLALCQGLDEARGACVAMIARPSASTLVNVAPIAILRPAAGLSRGIAVLLLGLEQSVTTRDC